MGKQNKYFLARDLTALFTLFLMAFFSCSDTNILIEEATKISSQASFSNTITTGMQDSLLTISDVYATSVKDDHIAEYSYDNDLSTYWSSNTSSGQFIRYDLGSVQTVYRLEIAWFDGNNRISYFKIKAGTDANNLVTIPYNGSTSTISSSGTTNQLEAYQLDTPVDTRYIRIQGYGNSKNSLNRISEIRIWSKKVVVTNDHEIQLPINGVYASTNVAPNIAGNTLDSDLTTKWSANGDGEYLRYDLGAVKKISRIKIAWSQGNGRKVIFRIKAGTEPTNTENVSVGNVNVISSSGTTNDLEVYEFDSPVYARYVRVIGYGTTDLDGSATDPWTEVSEAEIWSDFPDIDFNHWKVTLPVDEDNNGKPDEFQPTSLINHNYTELDELKPFMYDDSTDTSVVFYTYPAGSTTANSHFPRTELREQLTPGNNYDNWMVPDGGIMEEVLKVESISDNLESTNYDKNIVIVGQIHGVISQEDMATYGFSSNAAPPLLKIKWVDGNVKAYKKSLIDETTTGIDLYNSDEWSDISYNFGYVGFDKFSVKIDVSYGKIIVTVNGASHVFEDISLQKWPFENYFKAGNYLAATNSEAFAYVKFYQLEVSH